MRLSDNELKLVTEIEKRQSDRKRGAWLNLAIVILLLIAASSGFQALKEQAILLGLLMAFAVSYFAYVYSAVRPEDGLMALLQRYVNQDPEAVAQIADSATAEEKSADSNAEPTI